MTIMEQLTLMASQPLRLTIRLLLQGDNMASGYKISGGGVGGTGNVGAGKVNHPDGKTPNQKSATDWTSNPAFSNAEAIALKKAYDKKQEDKTKSVKSTDIAMSNLDAIAIKRAYEREQAEKAMKKNKKSGK